MGDVQPGDIIAVFAKQSDTGWWSGQIDIESPQLLRRHGHFPAAIMDTEPLETTDPVPLTSAKVSKQDLWGDAKAKVEALKADLQREQQGITDEETLHTSGEWWKTSLSVHRWAKLLPSKPKVVEFQMQKSSNSSKITT